VNVTPLLIEIIGWAAAATILASYLLVSVGRLSGQSQVFQWMNVVGAGGFVINSGWHGAWPSTMLNVAWAMIGIVTLVRLATIKAPTPDRREYPPGGIPAGTFPPQESLASAEAAEAVIEVAELRRAGIIGDLSDIGRNGFLHQAEILGRKDGAAALRFVGHIKGSFQAACLVRVFWVNWSASVDSASAVVELSPPATAWATRSK
jgi:hypothetical protein